MFGVSGESEIEEKIREMEATEEGLVVYDVDVLDYQTILVSLKNCNAVFCCLDNPEGYDVSDFIKIIYCIMCSCVDSWF